MKLPRNVDGHTLARKLERLGYHSLRQKGSHLVLKPPKPGLPSIGVPAHRPLKVGMLHRILATAAKQLDLAMPELVRQLKL
ncbi:type II toxin-antitoxin system HicA family toxin [bacterium]|nr:type II toxin-antitoxin system HicA family toxin [bacterium]